MSEPQQPYSPPRTQVEDVAVVVSRPILGVALGVVTDIGGSIVVGSIYYFVVAIWLATQGMGEEAIIQTLTSFSFDSGIFLAGLFIGLLFSVLGGYVCASFAKTSLLKWGAVLAISVTVFGTLISRTEVSLAMHAIMAACSIAATFCGIWLYARRRKGAWN